MEIQLIISLAGIVSGIVGCSWITSLVLRKKYGQEIEILKAEVKRKTSDTEGVEIANAEQTLKIQAEYIVEPLTKKIDVLSKKITRLEKAINRIGHCPHAADCPVKHELQNIENNS